MSANPVNSWDTRLLAVSESTFGTAVAPANTQGLEVINVDLGTNESGKVRPKRDRSGLTEAIVRTAHAEALLTAALEAWCS